MAQEEIDRVVGKGRLPDFKDRDHLPVCTAIMKETLRWHPPSTGEWSRLGVLCLELTCINLGIPHLLCCDDSYRGYHIPAGAVVMGNIWYSLLKLIEFRHFKLRFQRGILHNKLVYPDPEKFDPKRFLKDGKLNCGPNDPSRVVFGFGRRYQ